MSVHWLCFDCHPQPDNIVDWRLFVTRDLLTVFASAVAGAASIVFVIRIAITIFAPQAFKTAGRLVGAGRVVHDAAPAKQLPVSVLFRMTLKRGRSALSETDPFTENSQERIGSEQQEKATIVGPIGISSHSD
jgi:hypothetical protein